MLKLMYITNRPEIAQIAEYNGVDWIFVDMEFIGKSSRQRGLDTVQNHHTIDDIRQIKSVIRKAQLLVRINPIHEANDSYMGSQEEIEQAIAAGADILMLPYFHSVMEVETFISLVNNANQKYNQARKGRPVQSCLLLETAAAAILIDDILNVPGINMVHIGLNDLHLDLGLDFMFQLLTNGTIEHLAKKITARGIPFGFGGIASLHSGALPGEYVLKEHYRLDSSMVILGRSFCNTNTITDLNEVQKTFKDGIAEIRKLEIEAQAARDYFVHNHQQIIDSVDKIVADKKALKK